MANIRRVSAALSLVFIIYNAIKRKKRIRALKAMQNKKTRRFWVSPFLLDRDLHCVENILLTNLLNADSKKYHNFLRVSHDEFLELFEQVRENITCQDTVMRNAISSKVKVAITLRYLATGDSHQSLEYLSRVGRSTISTIIPHVCAAIYTALQPKYMKVPSTQDEWLDISKKFEELWNFPHVLGAIDGKHVAITAPPNEGSMFFNYKVFHSIVLLAVVDAHYKFVYIDVGCNGRISDGGVYKNSTLYNALNTGNELNIPQPSTLRGTDTNIPYFLIGDDAFSLSNNLMKPYPRAKKLSVQERVFNYRICRARRVVENAFGIMGSRFRILRRTMEVSLANTDIIVKTCCVLHNYLRVKQSSYCSVEVNNCTNQDKLTSLQHMGSNFSSKSAREIRDQLANYCCNAGEISFQWQQI